jgi:hypothetical protein
VERRCVTLRELVVRIVCLLDERVMRPIRRSPTTVATDEELRFGDGEL